MSEHPRRKRRRKRHKRRAERFGELPNVPTAEVPRVNAVTTFSINGALVRRRLQSLKGK